jgi:hypothetical protein
MSLMIGMSIFASAISDGNLLIFPEAKSFEASLAAWYVAEARRMVARQRQRIGNLKAEGRSAVEAEQTLEVLLSRLELFVRPDPSPFGMAQKVKALLDSAVIRVADSRGFVVEGTEARYVVASANQLPFSPTYYAHKSEANTKHEPLARRILRVIDDPLAAVGRPAPEKPPPFPGPDWAHPNLLGSLGRLPHVWASCLLLDPFGGIAILGSPFGEGIKREHVNAYDALTSSVLPLQVADPAPWSKMFDDEFRRSAEAPVWALSLRDELVACKAEYGIDLDFGGIPEIISLRGGEVPQPNGLPPRDPFAFAEMRGSPVVVADGSAVALLTGHRGHGPLLIDYLAGWLLRDLARRAERKSR